MPVPKVCRLCMSKDNLGTIFGDYSLNSDDIFQATGVQVKTDDGLPQKICTKCVHNLKHVLDFREKCKNTENELLKMQSDSETHSCDSGDVDDVKKKPEDNVRRINIEFEKSDSEDESKKPSKEFDKQVVSKQCQQVIFKRRMRMHMAERHGELDKSRVKCDLCTEYVSKMYMNKHLRLVHKDGAVCIYCKENCCTREGLMRHLQTCSATCRKQALYIPGPIACDLQHVSLSQLYRHKSVEYSNQAPDSQLLRNDQKVSCDICEMKFFSTQMLYNHKRNHYNDEHYEISSIDNATPLLTKKDILKDRTIYTGPKKYRVPKIVGTSEVLINSLREVEEKRLAKWLIQMQDRQFVLDKTSLFYSIENIVGDPGVASQSHLFSWINDFLDKYPEIQVRETKNLAEIYSSIDVQVRRWFGNVQGYLDKNNLRAVMEDPSRVFSSDERLFFTATYVKYNLVQDKSHNVLFTANADGVLAPPMILFAYKEVPEEVMEKIPDGWAVRRSEGGIMCCDNFYEYVRDVFSPWLEKAGVKRPVILFLNAFATFLTYQLCSFCFQHGVELIALYPYSNEITPIELALFKPMNNLWKDAISKKGGMFPEVKELAPLLRDVVSKVPVMTIKEGFRKAGLFPMDVNNIDIPKVATVKRYHYLRNTSNYPRISNEMPQGKSKTREDSPKLGKVCKVYLSKKQLLERKEKEENEVKIKVEVNEDSEDDEEGDEVLNLKEKRKACKRKTQEKLKFESSDESE